jgi:hypothetical protein
MEELRKAHISSIGNLKGRDKSEDLSVNKRIILEYILQEWGENLLTGII